MRVATLTHRRSLGGILVTDDLKESCPRCPHCVGLHPRPASRRHHPRVIRPARQPRLPHPLDLDVRVEPRQMDGDDNHFVDRPATHRFAVACGNGRGCAYRRPAGFRADHGCPVRPRRPASHDPLLRVGQRDRDGQCGCRPRRGARRVLATPAGQPLAWCKLGYRLAGQAITPCRVCRAGTRPPGHRPR